MFSANQEGLDAALSLRYQVRVTHQRKTVGVKTLVHRRYAQHGTASTTEAMAQLNETSARTAQLGWVLESACSQLARWAVHPETSLLTLAVNISARQLQQDDFVEQVLAALNRTGANPDRLKLELTESWLVLDDGNIIDKMIVLKTHRVGVSLDDFGIGYASLSSLKRLPLYQLQIDQGFVRGAINCPNDAAIAKMIVAMADNMALTVLADGVDTAAQWNFLTSIGCHHYQGDLLTKPLPMQEFGSFYPFNG